MPIRLFAPAILLLQLSLSGIVAAEDAKAQPHRLNNLVTELLVVTDPDSADREPGGTFTFTRPTAGWILASATYKGAGESTVSLETGTDTVALIEHSGAADSQTSNNPDEAVRYVAAGEHRIRVKTQDGLQLERLVVRAIPELIHCGLGFDPAIKSYGKYDMDFLRRDILPNITTLIVPSNVELPQATIDAWHRQGKRFVAEVGINAQAVTADDHLKHWTGVLERAPFLDGFLINEFIVNNPAVPPGGTLSPERQVRLEKERAKHPVYEEAFRKFQADERYKNKTLYAYVGGSGKRLNQEVIGPAFVRTLIECGARIALERYLFEVSSPQKSDEVLELFVDGIADWETTQPGAKEHMVVAFGLFSMPPGGINKQPNVDYHVWMDRQMNVLVNNPQLAGIAGIEWWTTILADEETTRFVGRLYRHYAIEGRTDMLTRDPLFLTHIQNADFENGTTGWTLTPAEEGSISAKSFPRYGRIEGRYMGLGRPADPEHIGDTFLAMKRSPKGPNTFSQTIKDLEPGHLYSMKMFTCDYQDLTQPKEKKQEEARSFVGRVTLEGVDIDTKRSFTEMYSSNPEPPIPVWITYHWFVFRARQTTARLTVSDWSNDDTPAEPFGLEQTFNFIEIEPYHE